MQTSTEIITLEKKEKIEEAVVNILIDAYQKKSIDYFEMKRAAAYVLDKINGVYTSADLLYLLENMAVYWPIFKNLLTVEKGTLSEGREKEVIQKLSSYIKTIKTE